MVATIFILPGAPAASFPVSRFSEVVIVEHLTYHHIQHFVMEFRWVRNFDAEQLIALALVRLLSESGDVADACA